MPKIKDFKIVGCGLYGALAGSILSRKGYDVTIFDERSHIAGNIFTEAKEDYHIHVYGPHIFHTSNKRIWDYVNQFAQFVPYVNSPLARVGDKIYNLPFNMNTFYQLWGIMTPQDAKLKLSEVTSMYQDLPRTNLEEQALFLCGQEIYEKFIEGYTTKQWGRHPRELSPDIIKRLPFRLEFNNNYFRDIYQGIPANGYTSFVESLLLGINIELNQRIDLSKLLEFTSSSYVLYTGALDALFDYEYGPLPYRSLRFDHQELSLDSFQGNAVVNYCDSTIPFTRITEHKHFSKSSASNSTLITREYSAEWSPGSPMYYPVHSDSSSKLHGRYLQKARSIPNLFTGGRLADFKYYDMHVIVEQVLQFFDKNF